MDNGIRTKICILIICLRILRRVMLLSIRERRLQIMESVMSGLAESWVRDCTDDASVSTVGDGTKEEGEMSPLHNHYDY
jgi:hypothetical protein